MNDEITKVDIYLDLSENSGQEWTEKNIEDVFTICKKSFFDAGDQFRLLDGVDMKNMYGDNVLQAYMKGPHYNPHLLNKMMKEEHDIFNINNEGDSIFFSCLLYSKSNFIEKSKKLNWLLDYGCPINLPKYDLTDLLLFEYLQRNPGCFISGYYLKLINRILNMNLLDTNLMDNYPYISLDFLGFFCQDLPTIKWFDETFKMNKSFTPTPSDYFNRFFVNPIFHAAIHEVENRDVLNYIIEKDPTILIDSVNKYNILDYCLRYQDHVLLHLIEYHIGDQIDEMLEIATWTFFVNRLSTTFYYGLDRYYKKRNIIFGLKFKKIDEFPINIIKGLRLTLDDFEGDVANFGTGIEWTDGTHPDLLFPEDHPDKAEIIKKANEQSHDLKRFTKDFCINEYNKIMEYITNNEFKPEKNINSPFNMMVDYI